MPSTPTRSSLKPLEYVNQALLVIGRLSYWLAIFLLGTAACVAIAVGLHSRQLSDFLIVLALATVSMLVGGLVGGLFGFLFGLPRLLSRWQSDTRTDDDPSRPTASGSNLSDDKSLLLSNSNLEEVSDWITKIVVGLTLVNLPNVPSWLNKYSVWVAQGIQSDTIQFTAVGVFVSILALASTLLGFLFAYLQTRTSVMLLLHAAEQLRQDGWAKATSEDIIREAEKSAAETLETPGRDKGATPNEIERGKKIKEIAEQGGIDLVRERAKEFAREYEDVRASMPSGDSRTRRMETVVAKMRTMGRAVYAERYRLSGSPSPGDRLQAISCLQVQPDFDMIDWLAQRVGEEKPFVAYHALVALSVAANSPLASHYKGVLEAAVNYVERVSQTFSADTDRRAMFERLKASVATL